MPQVTKNKTILQGSEGLRKYVAAVFAHMSFGLLLTAIVSYVIASSPQALGLIFGTPLHYVVLFGPVGIALYLQARINVLSTTTAWALFYVYAAALGFSLSSIFLLYALPSIAQTFLTTATLFGVMSAYGYATNSDLTNFGSFLIMGLFGLIIASVINMFMHSSGLDLALSIIGAFIFIGLTAYDMQKIKWIYSDADNQDMTSKKSIVGALVLYLDFINLFLMLLRVMGRERARR